MKRTILYTSLVVNLTFTGIHLIPLASPQSKQDRQESLPETGLSPLVRSAAMKSPSVLVTGATAAMAWTNWNAIESPDYRQYVANLRHFGCPEETIADIVIADVRKVFARERAKRREVMAGRAGPAASTETACGEQEENQLLTALLGNHWRLALPETMEAADRRFRGLPASVTSQVLAIEREFDAQSDALETQASGSWLRTDRQKLQQLRQDKEERIAGLIGPEALENYLLASSGTVQAMQESPVFSFLSDSEFQAVARAQLHLDKELAECETASGSAERRASARQRFQADLSAALGEERLAQFERARDFRYQQLAALAARFGLPSGTAEQVFALRQRADALPTQADAAGSASAHNTSSVQEQIRHLLAAAAYAAYQETLPD